MKQLLAIALITLGMTAAAAPPKAPVAPTQKIDKRIEGAKNRVLEMLKDPDSAKFKDLHVAADGETICGAVNSKNSMGGYVGFQNFIVESDGGIFFDDTGPSFPGLIRMRCKGE